MEAQKNPIFKKLSFDSLNRINNQINLKKTISQKVNQEDKRFETGNILSDRIKRKFPTKLFGVPIEEIDENFKHKQVCFLVLRILYSLFSLH
jgi:hypothetical protein